MDEHTPWCCLRVFGHRRKYVQKALDEVFPLFIHHTENIQKIGAKVITEEYVSVSGFIFVQGEPEKVQGFLNSCFEGFYLMLDCCHNAPVVISHRAMLAFMNLSKFHQQLYFVQHDLSHYAQNNVLVRGTSGVLKDCEGYVVRFHRDRMLVVKLANGLTVAIKGVNKSTFASVEDVAQAQELGILSK